MHAYVSLRRGGLCLLALRGGLRVGNLAANEVRLEPGLSVAVTPELELEVEAVVLPERVLAVAGLGRHTEILLAPVYSLVEGTTPRLVSTWIADALAWIWSDGESWRARTGQKPMVELGEGVILDVVAHRLTFLSVPTQEAGETVAPTKVGLFPPMRIVTRYDTVHIHRDRRPVVTLSGYPARIVSELGCVGVPLRWSALADQLWRGLDDRQLLRQRLDKNLKTLRDRLREGGVRPDLVRADGKGHYELLLMPGDELVDQT